MKPLHFDAINPFTGKPFTWGDKNLKFVDGHGVYLEPGDIGFVPYGTPQNNPKKPKPVKHQVWYPTRTADQIVWLENFRHKILGYIATLGLGAPAAAAVIADCRWLIYVLGSWLPAARAWGMSCTDASAAAQTGSGDAALTLPVFTAPTLPGVEGTLPAVVPMPPGGLGRIFAFVQMVKDSAGDTEAIETDLRIVGTEDAGPDLATLQPVLTARVSGLHVELRWGWGGHGDHVDLLQIQVDRADGKGWVDLVHDTTPNYTDTAPFPANATVWKYRAIFHVNDAPVGLWSATVSVPVGG
jgi:hypothetical protein